MGSPSCLSAGVYFPVLGTWNRRTGGIKVGGRRALESLGDEGGQTLLEARVDRLVERHTRPRRTVMRAQSDYRVLDPALSSASYKRFE